MNFIGDLISSVPFAFVIEGSLVVVAALLALAVPDRVNSTLKGIERAWKRLASSPRRCLWLCFFFPIAIRLAMLPIYPVPQPSVHDEFSHLLVADTMLHGRLANPTHPLWRHFETMHVIFSPSYASKYPVGQGAALALPQVFGLPPYWGIWISIGAMTSAIFWMLQAWLTPAWALAGGLVLLPRITVFGYWVHSYWGGAVPAIGGALALGAFARMVSKPQAKYAWIMGAGMFLGLQSRPYESVALGIVLGIALLLWLKRGAPYRIVLPPLAIMGLITIAFSALHNYSVTGDPLKLPYQRNRELYGTPQTFYWQKPVPEIPSPHTLLMRNQAWQLEMHERGQSWSNLAQITRRRLYEIWLFFAAPLWTPALFFVPWLSRRYRLPLAALGLVLAATLLYPFSSSHYYGPVAGVFVLIVLAGLRHMRVLTLFGKPSGMAFCSLLLLTGPISYLVYIGNDIALSREVRQPKRPRTQLLEALEKMGGSHVVFVRYLPDHDFHNELVYNAADIDASNVVWARDMGPIANLEVLQYYKGRRFWIFEPDLRPAKLTPYQN